jgi:Tfp pilus assembly protein PilF
LLQEWQGNKFYFKYIESLRPFTSLFVKKFGFLQINSQYTFMRFVLFLLVISLFSCADHTRDEYNIPVNKKQNIENEHLAALSILSDAIKNNPSNPDNYYKRAVLHYKIENFNDALVDINRAERLDPNSGLFLYFKAKIQNALNDKTGLKNALDAESQNFSAPDLYVLIADLYLKNKNFKMSQQYMQKAEAVYPYNSDLFLVKGSYYAKQGDTVTAINNYKRALALKPHGFEPYDKLIKIYTDDHLLDSALVFNEKALKFFPTKRELIYNKGNILLSAGALDSATRVFKTFLKLEPTRFDVLAKIGDIYFRKKNYAAAFLIYEKWGKSDPENYKPFLKAAYCFEQQNRYSEAKKYLEKAIEIDPKNQSLVADLTRVSYKIDEINNSYVSNQNNYFYKEERKPKEAPEPEPERRIFGGNIGTIEKIQKRTPVSIGKDTTRN